ncbi:hypothetical protein [Poseidonibacter ostreae]|uniref:Uncharacterized protein n=1 Tax=Poseidonibacter ostreae TaxID=2654171 RepID=A0A6L4WWI6_9BACT|nr:hypothetical protein [Poseidonibacter ostreae]KAB7891412.1 hypothetical protein GBG19_00825 [Poseidonibacter ostreae]
MATIRRRTNNFRSKNTLIDFFTKKGYIENEHYNFIEHILGGEKIIDVDIRGVKICEDFEEVEIHHVTLVFFKNRDSEESHNVKIFSGTRAEVIDFIDNQIIENEYKKYVNASGAFNKFDYTPDVKKLLANKSA